MSSATKPFAVTVSAETESGDPFFRDDKTTTTPGTEQTLLSYSVPSGKILDLRRLKVSCIMSSSYRLLADSTEIHDGIVGSGNPTDNCVWANGREIGAGVALILKFFQPANAQVDPSVDVSFHLEALLKDAY